MTLSEQSPRPSGGASHSPCALCQDDAVVRVGAHDAFEYKYRSKLRAILSEFGLPIEYPEDRATLDLGLHLYERPIAGNPVVSQVRVWFQAKGIRAATLPAAEFELSSTVPVRRLPLDHVRFWYGAPTPVYLVVYVEAKDLFLSVGRAGAGLTTPVGTSY